MKLTVLYLLMSYDVWFALLMILIAGILLYLLHGPEVLIRPDLDNIKVTMRLFTMLQGANINSWADGTTLSICYPASDSKYVDTKTIQEYQWPQKVAERQLMVDRTDDKGMKVGNFNMKHEQSLVIAGKGDANSRESAQATSSSDKNAQFLEFQATMNSKALRKKAEKEARHEMVIAEKKRQQKEKENRLRLEEEKAVARKREELANEKIALQKQRQKEAEEEKKKIEEDAEYEMWKAELHVQDEGENIGYNEESESLLTRFLSYVKGKKFMLLEDLAMEFGIAIKDVVSKIQELQKLGLLSGIFDDHGKFLYITDEEMDELAKCIQKQGRVSKELDLQRLCNRYISLYPDITEEKSLNFDSSPGSSEDIFQSFINS